MCCFPKRNITIMRSLVCNKCVLHREGFDVQPFVSSIAYAVSAVAHVQGRRASLLRCKLSPRFQWLSLATLGSVNAWSALLDS